VLNERRQNYENRPYGLAGMAIVSALYPPDHPYHWLTIGEADDIRAAHLDDVRAFFQRYYHPANASLALAGDIDVRTGLALAERYFAEIPGGEKPGEVVVARPDAPVEDVRLVLEDRVELPRLYLAWHSPGLYAEGDAELDLVGEVLSSGKTSRLYRSLVYEQRIATEVAASQNSRELGSFFQIVATAAPGRTLAEVERAISKELAGLIDRGPTPTEMERCLAQAESHFLFRLQTVGGFGGKSDQLNAYNTFLGDPGYFERDLERYRSATAVQLQATAARWLKPDRRIVLSVVPRGRVGLALAESRPVDVS
jgi:zinc protease